MCRQRPQQRCAGDHRSSPSTETYITTPARAPSAAVSRWRPAQQTKICQRWHPAESNMERIPDDQHFSLRSNDNQQLTQRVVVPISSIGQAGQRLRNARYRPTATDTSQNTAKSASEPPTWLQTEHSLAMYHRTPKCCYADVCLASTRSQLRLVPT